MTRAGRKSGAGRQPLLVHAAVFPVAQELEPEGLARAVGSKALPFDGVQGQ